MEVFKSLDIYRKLPSDFVQPTYSGAMCKFFNNSINNKHYNNSFIIFQ